MLKKMGWRDGQSTRRYDNCRSAWGTEYVPIQSCKELQLIGVAFDFLCNRCVIKSINRGNRRTRLSSQNQYYSNNNVVQLFCRWLIKIVYRGINNSKLNNVIINLLVLLENVLVADKQLLQCFILIQHNR